MKAYGFDINRQTLETAKENAIRAGVADKIEFARADIRDFAPKSEKGTVITNPPYGERMLSQKEVDDLIRSMGRVFPRKHGWSYSIISPSETFEESFGRKADKRRKLYNGMIKCQLYFYFK